MIPGAQFGPVNVGSVSSLVGQFAPSSPLYELKDLPEDVVKQIGRALIEGAASGKHSTTIAAQIARITDTPYWRANLIARTELLRSYRNASLEQYRANQAVGTWVWHAELRGACIACISQHGSVHPLDEDMESHPNCRCTMIPQLDPAIAAEVGAPDLDIESGEDWFAGLDSSEQAQILGPGRTHAYQQGASLSDFVGKAHSAEYGTHATVLPLHAVKV